MNHHRLFNRDLAVVLNFNSIVEGLRQTDRRPARFQRNNHTSSATVTTVVNQDADMPLEQVYRYLFAKKNAHTNAYF
jgi:hypothetical protein